VEAGMTLTGSGLRLLNAFARGRIYNFSDTTECDPGNNLRWANLTDGSECMTYDLHEEMTVMIRVLASSLPSAGGAGVSFGQELGDYSWVLFPEMDEYSRNIAWDFRFRDVNGTDYSLRNFTPPWEWGQQTTRGSWFHIAAVFHWGHIKLYINGELVARRDDLPRTVLRDMRNFQMHIGHDVRRDYADSLWFGLLADLRIYKYPADQEEIKAASTANLDALAFPTIDPCAGLGLDTCTDDAGAEKFPIVLKVLDDGSFPKQIDAHEDYCRHTRFPNELENADLFYNGASVISCPFDGPIRGWITRRRNFTVDSDKAHAPYKADGTWTSGTNLADTDKFTHGVGYLIEMRRLAIQEDFWKFMA